MLTVRRKGDQCAEGWIRIDVGGTGTGLNEDIDYEIRPAPDDCTVFVDDVELLESAGWFRWRPAFYAGRVRLEVLQACGAHNIYHLQVEPAAYKASADTFAEMVATIRAFDQRLLGGTAAATQGFGHQGGTGLYPDQVLLARLRLFGQTFLDSVAQIARAPHQKFQAERSRLPLNQVRRLHPTALRDRQLLALIRGPEPADEHCHLPVQAWSSSPTVDTPANRVLLALLQRFLANVRDLLARVRAQGLGGDKEEQRQRADRRAALLQSLEEQARQLTRQHPFKAVKAGITSSSGLTQIAAQPLYGKAYRLGCRALARGVEGEQVQDELNISPSWGIYELWCCLQVKACIERCLTTPLMRGTPRAVAADMAFHAALPEGGTLELLFQGRFPSGTPSQRREGYSISRERYPDVVIVEDHGSTRRTLIFDAKWRSGRANVLEAMESAHIYHDSLRLDGVRPEHCILLLPGGEDVKGLGSFAFIETHGVGALCEFHPGGAGIAALTDWLRQRSVTL